MMEDELMRLRDLVLGIAPPRLIMADGVDSLRAGFLSQRGENVSTFAPAQNEAPIQSAQIRPQRLAPPMMRCFGVSSSRI